MSRKEIFLHLFSLGTEIYNPTPPEFKSLSCATHFIQTRHKQNESYQGCHGLHFRHQLCLHILILTSKQVNTSESNANYHTLFLPHLLSPHMLSLGLLWSQRLRLVPVWFGFRHWSWVELNPAWNTDFLCHTRSQSGQASPQRESSLTVNCV